MCLSTKQATLFIIAMLLLLVENGNVEGFSFIDIFSRHHRRLIRTRNHDDLLLAHHRDTSFGREQPQPLTPLPPKSDPSWDQIYKNAAAVTDEGNFFLQESGLTTIRSSQQQQQQQQQVNDHYSDTLLYSNNKETIVAPKIIMKMALIGGISGGFALLPSSIFHLSKPMLVAQEMVLATMEAAVFALFYCSGIIGNSNTTRSKTNNGSYLVLTFSLVRTFGMLLVRTSIFNCTGIQCK